MSSLLTLCRAISLATALLPMAVRSTQLERPATSAENLAISARTAPMPKSTGQHQLCLTGLPLMCLQQLLQQTHRILPSQLHPLPLWHRPPQSSLSITSPASAAANFPLFSLIHDIALALYFVFATNDPSVDGPFRCYPKSFSALPPWNLSSKIPEVMPIVLPSTMHRRLHAFHDLHHYPPKN